MSTDPRPKMWWHVDADLDPTGAEWYDQIETGSDDVNRIRQLIGDRGPLRILEPFCGTGRILIPLAQDGHTLVGMDISGGMLVRAEDKIAELPADVQNHIDLLRADVTETRWPEDFDVVIMGGNWPYVLASPEQQEGCIASAAASLRPGGFLLHDSDHMEGNLAESWQKPGVTEGRPWTSASGVHFEGTSETIWFDARARLHESRRRTIATFPDGRPEETVTIVRKHPVSRDEVRGWIEKHGFAIEWANETEGRITYWARKISA